MKECLFDKNARLHPRSKAAALLGYAREYKVTSLTGTFFLNVQCVISRLKSLYSNGLSIKCCIFGAASFFALFLCY